MADYQFIMQLNTVSLEIFSSICEILCWIEIKFFADKGYTATILLDSKSDMINEKDDDGCTPLLIVAKVSGMFSVGNSYFSKKKLLQRKRVWIFLFIFLLVKLGSYKLMKYLISKGADVDAKDDYDRTPLHWSAENGKSLIFLYPPW